MSNAAVWRREQYEMVFVLLWWSLLSMVQLVYGVDCLLCGCQWKSCMVSHVAVSNRLMTQITVLCTQYICARVVWAAKRVAVIESAENECYYTQPPAAQHPVWQRIYFDACTALACQLWGESSAKVAQMLSFRKMILYLYFYSAPCPTPLTVCWRSQRWHFSLDFNVRHWRIQEFRKGGHMVSAEREPIWESEGSALSRVQGQSPWSGGLRPPEAEGIFIISDWLLWWKISLQPLL
jgi:hypothetical protein